MAKKNPAKKISMPLGIAIGIVVSLLVTLIGTAITAWMIAGEYLGEASIGYAAIVIYAAASAAGAMLAAGWVGSKRLPVCICSGAGYLLLLLACTALFFGGQYQAVTVSALIILLGSSAVALLGTKRKKTAKHKLRISAYR